ncbi:hypothetical protein BOTBODRAFT_31830 [Botryobasidium botryosum FD-172 SS1]|uniref:Uncharacterized protein n=1 Tax=Botryobasidium botryosum (strain FD-172 SS1) TaxID=930990 RepID=A0A067MLA7_BOTB1|nr:hypothetical protein BOTBODRAFT_31830 [Botryobasidium botryosum FD-172 SS1]
MDASEPVKTPPSPPRGPQRRVVVPEWEQKLQKFITPLGSSPWPVWGLSSLLLATTPLSPARHPLLPPFYQRFGFGLIFAGAGYVLSTGDVENGSGIATAWSLTYTFLHLRSSIRSRSILPLSLSSAVLASASVYGLQYFHFGPLAEVEQLQRSTHTS